MNNIGIPATAFANVVTPFSPVGKQAVGLENADAKDEVFTPVVEPSANAGAADNKTDAEADESREAREQKRQEAIDEREQRQQQREDQQQIAKLAARDREVRAHEQAHASVGGQYAGAPSFTYQRGPDGVNYAIGGEVPISLPRGGDNPEQKLAAAQQVQRAALAPADPSPQDRRVAASAANAAQDARAEIAEQQRVEQRTEREEEAEKTREAKAEDDTQTTQAGDKPAANEQPAPAGPDNARRSAQLSNQLVTFDNIQKGRYLGSVFDQRV